MNADTPMQVCTDGTTELSWGAPTPTHMASDTRGAEPEPKPQAEPDARPSFPGALEPL